MSSSSSGEPELERLKRALRVHRERGGGAGEQQVDEVLADHADLADLLAPMLGRESAGGVEAARGGERHLGDFAIGGEVARGGMGIVYEARQLSLSRRVALKVLHPGLVLDERAKARFVREARLAAGLDHPGITRVLAADTTGEVAFYAMEFVDGVSLDRVLRALSDRDPRRLRGEDFEQTFRGLLPAVEVALAGDPTTPTDRAIPPIWRSNYVELVLALVGQVADALEHAHEHGIIHRDVKPGNVILRRDGTVALTDFGLARETGNLGMTMTGDYIGTPYYSSPEQIRGAASAIDGRSDVFALGVMLYELLTLRRPFEAATALEVRERIVSQEPARPQRWNPAIAADLSAVVIRALEKSPVQRYATAAALAADLRCVSEGRPVSARPVRPWVRWWRWHVRNPVATAFLGVLIAVAAAASVLAWQLRERGLDETLRTARLLTQSGSSEAEPLLWQVHQARSDQQTRWGLVEFYRRFRIRHTLGTPNDPVRVASASGDGEWLAVMRGRNRIEVFSTGDLDVPRHAITVDMDATHLIVSHDGRQIAVTGATGGLVVDVARGVVSKELAVMRSLQFCDGGRYLVGVSTATTTAGARIARFDLRAKRELTGIPIPPDSKVVALHHDEFIVAPRRRGLRTLSIDGEVVREAVIAAAGKIAVSDIRRIPGDEAFVVREVGRCWLFEREQGEWHSRLLGSMAREFTTDSRGLVVSAFPGRLEVIDSRVDDSRQVEVMTCERPAIVDRGLASTYADGSLRVWDIESREGSRVALPGGTRHAAAFVDERTLVTVGAGPGTSGRITTLRVAAGRTLSQVNTRDERNFTFSVAAIPGTRLVITAQDSGSKSGVVRRWRVGPEGQMTGGESIGECDTHNLVARADGRWLAAAGEHGTAGAGFLWPAPFEPGGMRPLISRAEGRRSSIAFVGSDLVVAAGRGGVVTQWRLDDPQLREEPFCAPELKLSYHCLASASTEHGWALAAGRNDGKVAVWWGDRPRTRPVLISCHLNRVFAVAFAEVAGERVLVSGDIAGRVVVSNPRTGVELCELRSADLGRESGVFGVVVHPKLPVVAIVGQPNTVELIQLDYGFDAISANASRAAFSALSGGTR